MRWSATIGIAAAAIAIVVLAAQVASLHSQLNRANSFGTRATAAAFDRAVKTPGAREVGLESGSGATLARLVLLPDGSGYLRGDHLTPLPPRQTYQLWALTGNAKTPNVVSAGLLGPDPSAVSFRASGPVHGFAVTIESAGGVVTSHHTPIASAAAFVADRPGRAARPTIMRVVAFGVYVHIPFCATRCDYCDFATWTDRGHLIDVYVDACVADLARRNTGGYPAATSVFFGGGTPSLLGGDQLVRILDAIVRTDDAEVTVECNPDSVDAPKLAAYRRGGVNRLSFGVQSMSPHVLAALGRTHDRGECDARRSRSRSTRASNTSTST